MDAVPRNSDNPVDQYALIVGGIKAAKEGASLPLCFEAVDLLATMYDVGALRAKTDVALAIALKGDSRSSAADNAAAAIKFVDELVRHEDFASAEKLTGLLRPVVAMYPDLGAQLGGRSKQIDDVTTAIAQLRVTPKDPAANLTVGLYYILVLDRWEKATTFLASGSDPEISKAASDEIGVARLSGGVAEVGNEWWTAAEKQQEPMRGKFRAHAVELFKGAIGGASGLGRNLMEKRIAEFSALLADEHSFSERATVAAGGRAVEFFLPPTTGSLRHVARLANVGSIRVQWFGYLAPQTVTSALKNAGIKCKATVIKPSNPKAIDSWLIELSRPDTAFALHWLSITGPDVTDAAIQALSRPDTGLRSLNQLQISSTTHLTDAGMAALSQPNGGLKSLKSLAIYSDALMDGAVIAFARPDTSLKELQSLALIGTKVTDAALRELTRPDTGLALLSNLELLRTAVTDAGLKELARPDSGLKRIEILNVSGSRQLSDVGLGELARSDTSLKLLRDLNIENTNLGDAGFKMLARKDSGLQSLIALNISGTAVTRDGLMALAAPDSGLHSLSSLIIRDTKTQMANASAAAIRKNRPNLRVYK